MSLINFALNVLTETARYEWSYEEGWGNWKTIESTLACVAGGILVPKVLFFRCHERDFRERRSRESNWPPFSPLGRQNNTALPR